MAVWWPQSGVQRSYHRKILVLVMEIERCWHPLSFSAGDRDVEISREKGRLGFAQSRGEQAVAVFASSYHRRPLDSILAVRWFGEPHTGFVFENCRVVVLVFVLKGFRLPAVLMFIELKPTEETEN